MSRNNRQWTALRALPLHVVLDVLGVRCQGESLLCPRYPGCYALFEAHEDPARGISVRCTREGCILGRSNWPEWAAVLHFNITHAEAVQRLLDAGRDHARLVAELAKHERRGDRLAALMELGVNV